MMKTWIMIFALCCMGYSSLAQSDEAQQLLLNVEKLSQFKKILQNMHEGYKILAKGYTTIKDISAGSFSLHKTFLDALLEVSPAVKKYKRIADIINCEVRLVREYKSAFDEFKQGGTFTPEEIDYLGNVYGNLLKESGESLEELALVVTAGTLRMSDNERLEAIDRIYSRVEEQVSFLKSFNSQTGLLALQRKSEQANIDLSRKLRGR